jgi:predicted dehydrogenase
MLDPAVAGGGCLRNVGLHGIDAFLHTMGEHTEVTGAQLSSRALGKAVEDYATLLLRTSSGVLGTIEVGNTFPGRRGDAEWRLAGRDALLVHRGDSVRLVSAAGEQVVGEPPAEPLPVLVLRDALARWQRGEAPAASLEDCYRAMQLVDDAYRLAEAQVAPRLTT